MIKAKNWSGKDLKGVWQVTIKIDGVRALWNGTEWISRRGTPLYNLPRYSSGPVDCEVYCGGFKETIERVRASTKPRPVHKHQMYGLHPLDGRLKLKVLKDPTAAEITSLMNSVIEKGYEGLVLRQEVVLPTESGLNYFTEHTWLKVKPTETYDVPVTDMLAGTGKHEGRMGALMTPMGKVGTGFTDAEREEWWKHRFERTKGDTIIEVECMKLTDDGKFRHPRFVRTRPDK